MLHAGWPMTPLPPAAGTGTSTGLVTRDTSSLPFFALVFALSIPFWLVGAVSTVQLAPGLPASALMSLCPSLSRDRAG
jgi:hypothetical protein